MFGPAHLVCIALCLMLVGVLVAHYRHTTAEGRKRQECLMAGAAVALLVSKDISYWALGIFEPLFWPLHICNFCEYLALLYSISPGSRLGGRLADLLFCWGLSGGPGALLFPGWSYYTPACTYASLCGFAEHALIFACALAPLSAGDYIPRPRRVWFPITVSLVLGLFFLWLNPRLGTNFFFVSAPEAAGAPFRLLVNLFGRPWWLLAYLAAAVSLWAAFYGLWRFFKKARAGL